MKFKKPRIACAIAALAMSALAAFAQPGTGALLRTTSVSPQDQWAAMKNSKQTKSAVVRPMGYSELTQLTQSPFSLTRRAASRTDVKKLSREVPTVGADYKMPAQIYGLLVYANNWPNNSGTGRFGVYTFTADKPSEVTAVVKNDLFAASGGAIYANGQLNVLNYSALWGSIILDYDYYQYSTQYWDELQHVHADDITRLMSVCGCYDAETGKYFAVMYTEDMAHQVFGTLDYGRNSRSVIYEYADEDDLAAIAINAEGRMYGVRFDGGFVEINKANGRQTKIGETGIHPKYLQSAAFDPRTGRLFWAVCSEEDPIGLYEIDITTGEAKLIEKFKNNEEFVGLYIPQSTVEEDAPAAPTSLSATFSTDSLGGAVRFRLPRQTYAGETIADAELGYRIYINDSLAAEGTGVPGNAVSADVSVPTSAMYRFEACAVNAAGQGVLVHLDKYVGKDAPVAPTNVKLVATDGNTVQLTWNAPTSGVNKGYVNRTNLNYTLLRMPDSVVVAEHIAERTFSETIQTTALANYYYVVTPYNDDIMGISAESNRLPIGEACEIPYFEDFEDLSVVPAMFTIIDANKDGTTWRYGHWNNGVNDCYYQYNEDQKTPADDWLITPPIHLLGGHFYHLSFKANCSFYGNEKVSASVGRDKTVEAMKTEVIPMQVVTALDPTSYSGLLKVDEEGNYYFGFHAQSDADMGILDFDDISIVEGGVFTAPDTVTNFRVEPGRNGVRTAKLTFNAPTTNFYGEPVSEITKIEVYRGKALRKTFEDVEPGSELTFNDTSVPNGMNTYYVYTYNSYGSGIPAEQSAWVGTDIPSEPTDVTLTMSGLNARLSWKAPTTGQHGGYITPSSLTYNIEDMNSYIKGDHRSGTTYSENRGSKQEFLFYRVSAQSSAGGSNYAYSNTVISGSPYALPFSESFAGAKTEQLWSQQSSGGEIGLTNGISADNDKGCAIFKPAKRGDTGLLTSGKINIKTADHPILQFYYYAVPGQQTSLSVGIVPNGDADNLKMATTINYATLSGAEGWRKVRVDLSDYRDADFILLSFIGQANGNKVGDIAFDAVTVSEQFDNDLAVDAFVMPATVEAGKTVSAVVTVANVGRHSNGDYTVQLLKNGLFADELDGRDLAAGQTSDFTFEVSTAVTDAEDNVFEARVVFTDDADQSNNSATHALTIEMPLYPVPVAGQSRVENDELRLVWTAPDLTPRNVMTTEGFENEQAFSIDNIGKWTVLDVDKKNTAAIVANGETVVYDHVGEPMAFQVFNTDMAGLGGATQLAPHGGSQMLINMVELNGAAADDWLISPELLGSAQTISFWVKSIDATNIEKFEVLASQTGMATGDFSVVEASVNEAPADWTEVTAQLPQGTKYFAIRVKGVQKFMFMVDDISYALFNTSDLKLLGYNVYWEGELLNDTPIADTSYAIVWFGGGEYRVSAVYEQGESALSEPFSIDVDGIKELQSDARERAVRTYNLAGQRVSKARQGIYIVNGRKQVVK